MPNYKGVWVLNQVLEAIGQDNWPRNPSAPTIGTATAGDSSATVEFTAPTDEGTGTIASYRAVSTPGSIEGTASSSPITVSGLTNGTSYTFAVQAVSNVGTGPFSGQSNSVTPNLSAIALFGGGSTNGSTSNNLTTIQSVNMSSTGNTTSFGTLTVARQIMNGALSSATRAIWGSGYTGNGSNIIDYVSYATGGTASDFGDLIQPLTDLAALSNSTRGLFAGGYNTSSFSKISQISYITIASTGNATNFGNITAATKALAACASSTRGISSGGEASALTAVINYVTIASTGNGINFGNLTISRSYLSGGSNSTRGVFGGGYQTSSPYARNVIDYITIATTGNAVDFGDLPQVKSQLGSAASSTIVLFAGGAGSAGIVNTIDYITIASTGNAVDFGDLLSNNIQLSGTSSAHGGLS